MLKIGHGYDVHKFGGNGPITLCGVKVPYSQGLIAHSDGDVALHALCDALLGCFALGDIGHHFPDTDDRYKGINSVELLRHVYAKICERGYQLGNADITILAEAPKMAPHILDMRTAIAEALNATIEQISVKATTTEGLGFVGQKLGIAAHANVLIAPNKT